MTKPRLTDDLLEKILLLRSDWEHEARDNMSDEESHWDAVKYYRPIEEWAKAELEKRKLRKEKKVFIRKNHPKKSALTPESDEEADRNARALAAAIIRMRKERKENDND